MELFFEKFKEPGENYVALKTPSLHEKHEVNTYDAKKWHYYSHRDSYQPGFQTWSRRCENTTGWNPAAVLS